MKTINNKLIFLVILILTSISQVQAKCQQSNAALDSMLSQDIVLYQNANEQNLTVKIAASHTQRQAGFQYICEQTIKQQAMLFVFKSPFKAKFHMHNVYVPLDIAFIDKDGTIVSIQTMQPYSLVSREQPLYGADQNVQAVLETYQGYFEEHNISEGWKIRNLSQLIQ